MPNNNTETPEVEGQPSSDPAPVSVAVDGEGRIPQETDQGPQPDPFLLELETMRGALAEIQGLIEQRLSRDTAKEEAFNYLYAELEGLKRRSALLDMKPLYIDLILLYDRMDGACRNAGDELEPLLYSLREELKEILLRRDIEPISVDGTAFNPRLQRAAGVESAHALEDDGKVLRILREGFVCEQLPTAPRQGEVCGLNGRHHH